MLMLGAFYGLPFLPQFDSYEVFLALAMLVAIAVAVLAMYHVFERRLAKHTEAAELLAQHQQSAVFRATKPSSPEETSVTCACKEAEHGLQRLCLGNCG